jgi:hypothetical protein
MTVTSTEPARYSDEWLGEAESGHYGRGYQRAASYLAKLDTVERRDRAVSEAYTLMNIVPGTRFSGGVYDAASALLRLIAKGEEAGELYGEKVARTSREADQENRRVVQAMQYR